MRPLGDHGEITGRALENMGQHVSDLLELVLEALQLRCGRGRGMLSLARGRAQPLCGLFVDGGQLGLSHLRRRGKVKRKVNGRSMGGQSWKVMEGQLGLSHLGEPLLVRAEAGGQTNRRARRVVHSLGRMAELVAAERHHHARAHAEADEAAEGAGLDEALLVLLERSPQRLELGWAHLRVRMTGRGGVRMTSER